MLRVVLACFAVLLEATALAAAYAQTNPGSNSTPTAYLLRMERVRATEDICVLLRGDGQYHLERLFADRTDIFEGSIPPAELQELQHVLDSDELFQLKQDKISAPLIHYDFDQLLVGVLRPGYWQNLRFPDSESRKAYRQSLDPLLKWLDSLHKENHIKLSEEGGRNNCLPPQKIELKTRPVGTQASSPTSSPTAPTRQGSVPAAFVLRLTANHFSNGRMEKSCLVVYPEGGFHREISVQRPGNAAATTSVFEDSLRNGELVELKQFLDSAELQSRPSADPPSGVPDAELEVIFLFIPRGEHVQRLSFWKYFDTRRIGSGGMPNITDNGTKLLKPLNRWLKTNIEEKAKSPRTNAIATNCAPTGTP